MNEPVQSKTTRMQQIARRLASLEPATRQTLLRQLHAQGVALSRLPVWRREQSRAALSYAQSRLWFLWRLDPASGVYNMPVTLRLEGELDVAALQATFDALVARHEALRSRYGQDDEGPFQQVLPAQAVAIERTDFSSEGPEAEAQALARIAADAAAPFDLERDPPLRVSLYRLGPQSHILQATVHHIACDAWSLGVLLREFSALYGALREGRPSDMPALPIQYTDFALWQRDLIEAGEGDKQLAYWRDCLGGEAAALDLPLDFSRPALPDASGDTVEVKVSAALAERLRGVAGQVGTALSTLAMAAFAAMLYRHTGNHDIRLGVPFANRNRAETEGLIGFFVNTQVIRSAPDGRSSLAALARQLHERLVQAQDNQDVPFERLVEALAPQRSMSHSPLFQVACNHQPLRGQETLLSGGLEISPYPGAAAQAKFDLALDSLEQADGALLGRFGYATSLFKRQTVERMAAHWLALLETFADTPDCPIAEARLLTAQEQDSLDQWSRAGLADATPDDAWVHASFARQAALRPDHPALVFPDRTISYGELDRQSDRYARYLAALGIAPGTPVGVVAHRRVGAVATFLGLLKAGMPYVPLDPAHPPARWRQVAEAAGLAYVACADGDAGFEGLQRLRLDAPEADDAGPDARAAALHAESLAYIIYTSGSTGTPKGVAVAHGPLAMHCAATAGLYGMNGNTRELHFLSLAFDGAHERLLTGLGAGATLIMRDDELWEPQRTYEVLRRERATHAGFPPAYLLELAQWAQSAGDPPAVELYSFGGEAMPRAGFERVKRLLKPQRMINGYGPTETVVTPLVWLADGTDSFDSPYAPIGRIVGDRRAYVLDEDLNLVPPGVPGELYVGGAGLAREYWRRPAATAERYVPDPFLAAEGGRLYRTGDLVRWRADGIMEYLGRRDQQVKIRGFRIELGDIEAHLQALPEVGLAVVVARQDPAGTHLLAYVSPTPGADPQPRELRRTLAQVLPDYMVPRQIVVLPALPVTATGKVDRAALPAAPVETSEGREPESDAEIILAQIWRELLGSASVKADDNFFELGGDSIVSLQVVGRARQSGLALAARDVFQHQTLAELAAAASVASAESEDRVEYAAGDGAAALLPIQREFFAQDMPVRAHWNQSVLLRARDALQAEALTHALQAVLLRHDALRLRFAESDGAWSAQHGPALDAQQVLWRQDLASEADLPAAGQAMQRSLDLGDGPLLRMLWARVADGADYLLIAAHHLVVDGVSWRILLEDLERGYRQALSGQAVDLGPRTLSYQAWGEALWTRAQAPAVLAQLSYWEAQRTGEQALPCDNPQGSNTVADERSQTLTLDRTLTQRLLKDAVGAYRTQINDLLLTALVRAMAQWGGQASWVVNLEGHGRDPIEGQANQDLSRTIGWFTTLYPVQLNADGDLPDGIKRVKEQLRAVPEGGRGFGLLRHGPHGDTLSGQPELLFNYLGQFDANFGDDALFEPAQSEQGGETRDGGAPLGASLTLNGRIYGGVLGISFSYSGKRFNEETIARLVAAYESALKAVIAHCTDPAHAGLTPSDVPLAGLDQAQIDSLSGPARDIEDVYGLSPMQQGMLFHAQSEPGSGLYVNQLAVTVRGLDPERFIAAWELATQRHAILRTGFEWPAGAAAPVQIVQRRVKMPVRTEDWRGQTPADQDAALAALAQAERAQGFDLAVAPLQRLLLVQLDDDSHRLIWTHHHILMDGWSASGLMAEVLRTYRGETLGPVLGGYRDYIGWLGQQDPEASAAFWRERLARVDEPTLLANALPAATAAKSSEGHGHLQRYLTPAQTEQLKHYAQRERITLNTLVQGAWVLLLQRYTGQAAVSFGATVAGRPEGLAGADAMLGLFINTVPVIQSPAPGERAGDWLRALQQENAQLRELGHTPLYDIQRWAGRPGQPLFDSIVVFENYPVDQALRQRDGGLVFGRSDTQESTSYPFALTVRDDARLELSALYQPAHIDEPGAMQLLGHLEQLLTRLATQSDPHLGALSLSTDADAQQALRLQHGQPAADPAPCLLDSIAAQARRVPQAIALEWEGQQWTYEALDRRSGQIAAALTQHGAGPDVLVGLHLERGPDMVLGMLGVLKSGAAYVPLDPSLPSQRLDYIVRDAGIALALVTSVDTAPAGIAAPIVLRDIAPGAPAAQAAPVHAEQLAYVLYTSGSTGLPKGVAMRHGAVARLLAWQAARLPGRYRTLQFAAYGFDVSFQEVFSAWTTGATLVIAPEPARHDFNALGALLHAARVERLYLPFAVLQALAESLDSASMQTPALRQIITAGEQLKLTPPLCAWLAKTPRCALYNQYGPTETHVISDYEVRDAAMDGLPPIGRPIANARMSVRDAFLDHAPSGVSADLYLAGEALARGYHRQPAMTAERFIPDPQGEPGSRMYRSGDLARWRDDGNLDYQGRRDHQVKIRGHRVEIGEIESCLLRQPGLRETVVVPRLHNHARTLVAYAVRDGASPLDDDAWARQCREALARSLPDYMVPAFVVVLAALPLTHNGKVDRSALPEPQRAQRRHLPEAGMEQALAGIWSEVLGVADVDAEDNFFELGGDSIVSIQLTSRARRAGIHLTPKDVFEHQTLRQLAQAAQRKVATPEVAVDGMPEGDAPLLPIQRWFFDMAMPQRHHWNQSVWLQARQALDPEVLRRALEVLIAHHDALRFRYRQDTDGHWSQHYGSPDPAAARAVLWVLDCTNDAQAQSAAQDAQTSLDLEQGPSLRAVLMRGPGAMPRLLIAVHHLVIDGVSWRILLEDLEQAYRELDAGQAVALPARTNSVQAWGHAMQALAASPATAAQLAYWRQVSEGVEDPPRDMADDGSLNADALSVSFKLDTETTRQLLTEAAGAYRTQINDLLLAALGMAACQWSGRDALLVELEGHGREEQLVPGMDLSRTVGWFATMFPLRLQAQPDIASAIKRAKESLRGAPDKGLGYWLLKYLGDDQARQALMALPTARLSFNYLGQFDQNFGGSALLAPVGEGAGQEVSPQAPLRNWITVGGLVFQGQLNISVGYSRKMYQSGTITRLAQAYEAALKAVIAHCTDPAHAGLTPSDVPLSGLDQAQIDSLSGPARDIEDVYGLSPMQQGMLFHTQSEPGSGLYVNQLAVTVRGLDPARFIAAWEQATQRHAILRTGFEWPAGAGAPVQVVRRRVTLPVRVDDWRGQHQADQEAALAALAQAERAQGFELAEAPLQRLRLVQLGDDSHRLIWTHHHILMDGWSAAGLMADVLRGYRGETLPAVVGGYRDYIGWLRKQDPEAGAAFWRERLARIDEATLLANALPALVDAAPGHAHLHTRLTPEQVDGLKRYAQREHITLNTLVQGAWVLLLQRYTGQSAVAFGATVAGRPEGLAGAESMLGLFINTVPVIQAPAPGERAGDWLRALQQENAQLREYGHTPLYDIQRWAGRPGQPLFDSIVVFENYPVDQALRQRDGDGPVFGKVESADETNYPMTVVVDSVDGLTIHYSYLKASFGAAQVQGVAEQVRVLLLGLAQAPGQALGSLSLLDEQRRAPLLAAAARAEAGPTPCLHVLIQQQARRAPEAIALSANGQTMRYGELNARANRLARRLREQGVGPDVLVAVALPREPAMVVAILAVLKAGGAYLPLDPQYPTERLDYMLADSGARVVVTDTASAARFSGQGGLTVVVVLPNAAEPRDASLEQDLPDHTRPDNLAYCIYTSGSTGRPKGALLTHRNAARLLASTQGDFEFGPTDVWTLFHSYAFDFSVWEIFGALAHGGRLVLVSQEVARSPQAFHALLRDEQVTVLNQTPSAFRQLMEVPAIYDAPPEDLALRYVIFGGEALEVSSLKPWCAHFGVDRPQLVNMYGITETTVHVTYRPIAQADLDDPRSSPVGRAIPDLSLHVLDASLEPTPIGVAGELYVGGEGLARGYLGRPGLSAERFVPDGLGMLPGARLYRTGDLARRRADGDVDYLGRIDQQLKIRGFRIELGEIEAQLRRYPGLRDGVVIARSMAGASRLIAYVALAQPDPDAPAAIRRHLAQTLPEYMLPAHIVVLDRLPLTVNGKLDRAALPDPQAAGKDYEAPQGDVETTLADIWATLLGQPRVGATDNFFDLGGDSIIAMQVASRARRVGLALTPRDLFLHQTPRELAAAANAAGNAALNDRANAAGAAAMDLAPADSSSVSLLGQLALPAMPALSDAYALSPMQQGMVFHCLQAPEAGLYVNTLSLEIAGLDRDRFVDAWRQALERHDTLRTAFVSPEGGGDPIQVVHASLALPLRERDWRGRTVTPAMLTALAREEAAPGFDIGAAPLWRLLLVRLDETRYQFIWTHHHVLIDGWSTSLLMAEVLRTYRGEALPPPAGSYRDYIGWLQRQDAQASETFWRERLNLLDAPTLLADALRAPVDPASGHGQVYTRLDAAQTQRLQRYAQQERVTLNTLVQGAWVLLLQRYTGQSAVAFGATVAGRPESLAGADQLLGLFINTVPVIQAPSPDREVGAWLRDLQAENARVREHGHTPLYDIQRWAGRSGQSLFDSIVVFENYPVDQALREQGADLRFSGLGATGFTNYAMDLAVMVQEGELSIEYSYLQASFDAAQVARIRSGMERILAQIGAGAGQRLGSLSMEPATAQAPSRLAWNKPYPTDICVHRLIEMQARAAPDRCAVIAGDRQFSYGDINGQANRIAHWLLQSGVPLDRPVAVHALRSPETLAAFLGVLKAGAAYVPLDPAYPAERLNYLLKDSQARFVLSTGAPARPLDLPDGVALLRLDEAQLADMPATEPSVPLHTHSLAYVIYTSGSTGQPKGVAVAHGPLSMHCQATADVYDMDETSCELHFLSLAFDGAHERWLTPLIRGARIVLSSAELWTPEQTCAALWRHGATHAGFPPAYLQQLADWVEAHGNPPPVQLYSFGGEAMPSAGFDRIQRILQPRWLINGYGPTETVISPMVWKVQAGQGCDGAYAPIGLPVGDRSVHVLDDCLHPLPVGVTGELYIGGQGLAWGYWRQGGMSAGRFVPDPFSEETGARLYRTGDLVRRRENGVLEFVGRADQQIKIRGFRIEPGEIESRLRSHDQVRDAVVVVGQGPTGARLIAYVVAPQDPGSAVLRAHLAASLPDYMVPAHIIWMPSFPTLPSGKLDRRALPEPGALGEADGYQAPRTEQERGLAAIWKDVLGVERVGVTDNFYALGGDSLLSLKVIARVRAAPQLGLDLKLRDLMQRPRIADLVAPADAGAPAYVLPLNGAAAGAPLFCIHPGFGTVFDYEPIARRLQGQRQVHGIQSRMLLDAGWRDVSLASMAADYAKEIRRLQADGPYHLLGWSLGGTLAAAVSAELERAGQQVAFLGMIDPYVPRAPSLAATGARSEAQHLAVFLGAVYPAIDREHIAQAAADAASPHAQQAARAALLALRGMAGATESAYAKLDPDEVAHVYGVTRHLLDLAEASPALPAVSVRPHCWWIANRRPDASALHAQIGAAAAISREIGDHHYAIMRDPRLAADLDGLLLPSAEPALHADTSS